jgi:hypothetical protein
VNRAAVVLRQFLAERHPGVNSGYVESIAVFTRPLCRLKVNRVRTTVVRCSELIQLLLGQFFLHAPQRSGIGADIV